MQEIHSTKLSFFQLNSIKSHISLVLLWTLTNLNFCNFNKLISFLRSITRCCRRFQKPSRGFSQQFHASWVYIKNSYFKLMESIQSKFPKNERESRKNKYMSFFKLYSNWADWRLVRSGASGAVWGSFF